LKLFLAVRPIIINTGKDDKTVAKILLTRKLAIGRDFLEECFDDFMPRFDIEALTLKAKTN